MATLKNTTVNSTSAIIIATGTTSQRSGTVTSSVQSFTTTGPATFNVPTGVTSVEVLVVAGGGAGGNEILNWYLILEGM